MSEPRSPSDPSTAHLAAATLYSPLQIFVTCLLGTPLAAAWILSRNSKALGAQQEAASLLLRGTFVTAAVSGVASFLPLHPLSLIWPLTYSLVISAYVSKVYGQRYRMHAASGGRRGSWWMVFGTGLLGLLVLVAVMLALAFAVRRTQPGSL